MSINGMGVNRLVPGLIEQAGSASGNKQTPTAESIGEFKEMFSNLMNSVNELQMDSGSIQNAFLSGDPVELHQVMIKAEEAGVATELLLEIRNKLVSAYQDLLRMPL
jgi:flagellar hook-basal body complex protein FliE